MNSCLLNFVFACSEKNRTPAYFLQLISTALPQIRFSRNIFVLFFSFSTFFCSNNLIIFNASVSADHCWPVRSPDHDSQPAAELPEHDGSAAAPEPWFAQFPEGRHGRANAEHHGSVPTDAVLSGMTGAQLGGVPGSVTIISVRLGFPTRYSPHFYQPLRVKYVLLLDDLNCF